MSNKKIANVELRVMKGSHSLKDLSEEIGVHFTTLSTWFSSEMDEVKKLRVTRAIEKLDKEKADRAEKQKQEQ